MKRSKAGPQKAKHRGVKGSHGVGTTLRDYNPMKEKAGGESFAPTPSEPLRLQKRLAGVS